MRDFPEGLRSVILEAVHPPQEDLFTGVGVNMQHALDLLFERCAADAECNQAFPDLEWVFYETVEQLDAAPVTLTIRRPKDSQPYEFVINGDRLIRGFLDLLALTEVLPNLPGLIYDVHAGEWDSFAGMIRWTQFAFDELSEGLYFSVECAEEAPFASPEELASNEAAVNPRLRSAMNNEAAYQICQVWAVSPAVEIENQAVVSDIPTLILVGEHDPLTPPEWGRSTAENLSQVQYLAFPGVSHGVLPLTLGGGKCSSSKIVEDFLEHPTTPVEASCVAEVPVLFGSD
jgi:pimeloyl-ACP methyl ester carboxylesterase